MQKHSRRFVTDNFSGASHADTRRNLLQSALCRQVYYHCLKPSCKFLVTIQASTRILTFKFVVAHGNRQSAIGSNTIIWFYVFITLSLRRSAIDTRKSEATFEPGLNSYNFPIGFSPSLLHYSSCGMREVGKPYNRVGGGFPPSSHTTVRTVQYTAVSFTIYQQLHSAVVKR